MEGCTQKKNDRLNVQALTFRRAVLCLLSVYKLEKQADKAAHSLQLLYRHSCITGFSYAGCMKTFKTFYIIEKVTFLKTDKEREKNDLQSLLPGNQTGSPCA
jgi:hypothetical protein